MSNQKEIIKERTKQEIQNIPEEWTGSSVSAKDGQEWDKASEMDFTYTNLDNFIRQSLGENAHFSNAFWDGDFSMTLEEAQIRKYELVIDQLRIAHGIKVLDLGCGWGGWLKYIKDELGAGGTGVNLSKGQVVACRENGLDVYLKDARYIKPKDFGQFDAVTAFGSFEHCATVNDFLEGRQDEVYDDYFKHVANVLPKGGRFYMQSMVFSKNMIPYEEFDIKGPKDSAAYILALLTKHNPDSWLPYGHEHIERVASPYFKRVYYSDGRLDYAHTNREWTKLFYKFQLKKYLWFASLIPKLFTDKEFRYQLAVLRVRPNRVCFERDIMGHARLVFEKL